MCKVNLNDIKTLNNFLRDVAGLQFGANIVFAACKLFASKFADDTNLLARSNTLTELHNLENINIDLEFTYNYGCHQSFKRHRNVSTMKAFVPTELSQL